MHLAATHLFVDGLMSATVTFWPSLTTIKLSVELHVVSALVIEDVNARRSKAYEILGMFYRIFLLLLIN